MISLKDVLVLVHVFSMLSWLGAMYFNLTLLFPMYKSRPRNGYAELMQEQGTRAAPLLYLLIFLTASSGLAIVLPGGIPLGAPWIMGKIGCWLVMLGCHLYGSFSIWPRVFLALDGERQNLFFTYKLTMLVSAAAGTIAVVLGYLKNPGVL